MWQKRVTTSCITAKNILCTRVALYGIRIWREGVYFVQLLVIVLKLIGQFSKILWMPKWREIFGSFELSVSAECPPRLFNPLALPRQFLSLPHIFVPYSSSLSLSLSIGKGRSFDSKRRKWILTRRPLQPFYRVR